MKILRYVIGIGFIIGGALHFARPKPYLAMMPPWIPLHREAVAVSGIAEIAGGAALLSDRTARSGGRWLIALLVAVFPANVHMAVNPDQIRGLEETGIPNWALWARLPLQPLAIWLTWLATRPVPDSDR
ncbi:MAG TPA: hypothetical protein VMF31_01590 [Solirubrobacterales bacterium]|nr:hypothetical protein [Solirubrobacterales bacterium]